MQLSGQVTSVADPGLWKGEDVLFWRKKILGWIGDDKNNFREKGGQYMHQPQLISLYINWYTKANSLYVS